MKTYTVKLDDTLERISTISYGTPAQAALIRSANPGTGEPLIVGSVLTIPPLGALPELPPAPAVAVEGVNEVSVLQNGKPFRFFTTMRLVRSMDSFDQFSFASPFESENIGFRAAYIPLRYQRTEVYVGSQRLYSGVNVSGPPRLEVNRASVSSEGYALAGVWNDCTMPASAFPLEYEGLSLTEIATIVGLPFGLVPVFRAPGGASVDRLAITPSDKVLSFLTKITQQRNLLISNDEFGMPVFQKTAPGFPLQTLRQGDSPVRSVEAMFQAQNYFSHITALTPSFLGVGGTQYTAVNPFLSGVVRPLVYETPDTFTGDVVEAVNSKMGRMFANAISYRVSVAGWRNALGDLWAPNTRVRLLAPKAMVYNETEFLIRSVILSRNAVEDSSILVLVLPGSFEGILPKVLPWS